MPVQDPSRPTRHKKWQRNQIQTHSGKERPRKPANSKCSFNRCLQPLLFPSLHQILEWIGSVNHLPRRPHKVQTSPLHWPLILLSILTPHPLRNLQLKLRRETFWRTTYPRLRTRAVINRLSVDTAVDKRAFCANCWHIDKVLRLSTQNCPIKHSCFTHTTIFSPEIKMTFIKLRLFLCFSNATKSYVYLTTGSEKI